MAQRTIAVEIRELFGIIFNSNLHVGINAQHLVNYDYRKVNKLVKHEILPHFQFNINLLLKIGSRKREQIMSKNREGSLQIWIFDKYGCNQTNHIH